MLEKLKYSRSIGDTASTIIIDGIVNKCKDEDISKVNDKYITHAKDNFEDILIQVGRRIDIYSSNDKLKDYLEIIKAIPMNELIDMPDRNYSNIAVLYQENGVIKVKMYI